MPLIAVNSSLGFEQQGCLVSDLGLVSHGSFLHGSLVSTQLPFIKYKVPLPISSVSLGSRLLG